jgi:hypothetical protein
VQGRAGNGLKLADADVPMRRDQGGVATQHRISNKEYPITKDSDHVRKEIRFPSSLNIQYSILDIQAR